MASKNLPKAVKAARAATSDARQSPPATPPRECGGASAREILEALRSIHGTLRAVARALDANARRDAPREPNGRSHRGDCDRPAYLADTSALTSAILRRHGYAVGSRRGPCARPRRLGHARVPYLRLVDASPLPELQGP